MSPPVTPSSPPGFRSLNTPAKILIANQFFIAFGFSLVLPFLAIYLSKDLRLAPAIVGAVIGLRTLSQQGMFLFGGSLADKIGPRPIIIIGCALRVLSFLIFALWTSVPAIVVATICAGLGSALFNPAVRAYLMAESTGHRAEAFGMLNIASNVGALLGPVIGGALLSINFQVVSGAGCALYAVLMIVQLFTLPKRQLDAPAGGMLDSWKTMFLNRPFLIFTISGAIYSLLANQIAFGLVVEANRVTGRGESVTAIFLVSTLVSMFLQVRVMRWFRARWDSGQCLAIGTAIAAAGWLPIAVAAPFLATQAAPLPALPAFLAIAPLLGGAIIMAFGGVIALPFQMELIAVVGSERLVGTYYGYFSLIGGVTTAVGSAALGVAFGDEAAGLRWAPFAGLFALGLLASFIIVRMRRNGELEPRPEPAAV